MGATLGAMLHRLLLVGIPSAVLALAACGGGMRYQAMEMERPPEDMGLPPPSTPEYQACYAGHAERADTNGDGQADHVRVRDDAGNEICQGTDTNHDNRIDQWDVLSRDGKVARSAKDTDHDGDVDQHWTFNPSNTNCALVALDTNSDGTPDTQPVDTCAPSAQPVDATPKASP